MDAFEVFGSLGHDVDDAEHRLRPIKDGAWAEGHLDVIDQLEGDARATPEIGRAVPRLIDGVAVDEQEHMVARVAREENATGADLHVVQRVLGDHSEGKEVERFCECLHPVATQLVGRDDRGRGRRSALVLRGLRGGAHDRFGEGCLEIRGVRGQRCAGHCDEHGDSERPPRDLHHWMTLIRCSTPASIDTFWRLAYGRLSTRVGLADTRSKPSTMPWGT